MGMRKGKRKPEQERNPCVMASKAAVGPKKENGNKQWKKTLGK
jgi:hypothetical protein